MFTGIIEDLGTIEKIESDGGNLHFTLKTSITNELKIDQSVAHNGVCLTVVAIDGNRYTVTAIHETLNKTNLGLLKEGDTVNHMNFAKPEIDCSFAGPVEGRAELLSMVDGEATLEVMAMIPG